jgi:hypothetical protein
VPKNVFVTHPTSQAYAPNGGISLELSPKPMTVTRMLLVLDTDISTLAGGPASFEDAWDRIIQTLSLTGGSPSTTFFDFRSSRVAYNALRWIKQMQVRRPADPAASLVNGLHSVGLLLHFGVAPRKLNPNTATIEDDPYDLTAGIPPVAAGSLALQGNFGAAAAPGTGWTVNNAPLSVYVWGVQPLAGDPPETYQPRAFPVWSTAAPTPAGVTAQFGADFNIPAGDYLRSLFLETHLGANAPRSDGVIGSLKLYDQLNSRDIWRADKASGALLALQAPLIDHGVAPTDNGTTFVTPSVAIDHEPGIFPLPFFEQTTNGGHPLYGADMRNMATGDLKLQFGINNATLAETWFFMERYKLNPAHPLNQAPSATPAA